MRIVILSVVVAAGALASVPVRDACGEDATIVANVQENDPIQVRHGMVGETTPCYAVSVTQAGKEVQGFILGSSLAAVQEFERTRALESRVILPAPPPAEPSAAPEKKVLPPMPPIGPPFESWSGVDVKGKRMQITPGSAKVTLVTFWAGGSRSAERLAKNVTKTEGEFREKGLKAYGLMEAPNLSKANYYLDDMGLDYPQALDHGLARKYSADPIKGTTLVIDASNNVVAISSNPTEIRAAVARLLSLQ
jgi:hypothetical protein